MVPQKGKTANAWTWHLAKFGSQKEELSSTEGHFQAVYRGKNREEKISGDSNKVWLVKWTTMW